MAEATLERILSELARISKRPLQILWYGGEPTLVGRKWFERALDRARAHLSGVGLRHAIQTNATLIDDAWAELLAAHRFSVTVSLDGFAELHDLNRRSINKRPTHAAVTRGVLALQRAGIRPRASCVVTPQALPHAERLVDYFSELDVAEADFPPGMRHVSGRVELIVPPREYGVFMSRVLDRWLGLGRTDFRIRSLGSLARAMSGVPPFFCKLETGCAQYVTFGWDGLVYPCDEFAGSEDYVLGSVLDEPLDRIITSNRARALHGSWITTPQACTSCEWVGICRGGCPFERRLNGGIDQKSIICEGLKVLYAHMAKVLDARIPA